MVFQVAKIPEVKQWYRAQLPADASHDEINAALKFCHAITRTQLGSNDCMILEVAAVDDFEVAAFEQQLRQVVADQRLRMSIQSKVAPELGLLVERIIHRALVGGND